MASSVAHSGHGASQGSRFICWSPQASLGGSLSPDRCESATHTKGKRWRTCLARGVSHALWFHKDQNRPLVSLAPVVGKACCCESCAQKCDLPLSPSCTSHTCLRQS
eukprot:4876000-Amphidinium_carterae.2